MSIWAEQEIHKLVIRVKALEERFALMEAAHIPIYAPQKSDTNGLASARNALADTIQHLDRVHIEGEHIIKRGPGRPRREA